MDLSVASGVFMGLMSTIQTRLIKADKKKRKIETGLS
ncbi:MAG: hypothetical protein DDT32_01430 [Syntrophomonadaceae bacterium]|nr:hypothetical protein [Bacillota bacterium]MBT9147665.1 hypothetical protein [Bacillota bacterium]